MTQEVKVLATKSGLMAEGGTQLHKLSFDLHTHPWHVCVDIHVQKDTTEYNSFKNSNKETCVYKKWRFLVCFVFGDGFATQPRLTSNLEKFSCLSFPTARIKEGCYHTWQEMS